MRERTRLEGAIATITLNRPGYRNAQGYRMLDEIDQAFDLAGADREVRVSLSPEKLDAYGITATEVNSQLRGTNIDLGSGRGQDLHGRAVALKARGDGLVEGPGHALQAQLGEGFDHLMPLHGSLAAGRSARSRRWADGSGPEPGKW